MYEEFTTFITQLINTHVCLKKDFVLELIDEFDVPIKELNYPNNSLDNLSISLNFYKGFNLDYYNIINRGIKNKDIIISDELKSSYVNVENGKAYIGLNDNDGDIIVITHELAHYIDRTLNPHIVPDKYWFLGETFAFYIERELEKKLGQKYAYLFDVRKNSRLYMEKNYCKL